MSAPQSHPPRHRAHTAHQHSPQPAAGRPRPANLKAAALQAATLSATHQPTAGQRANHDDHSTQPSSPPQAGPYTPRRTTVIIIGFILAAWPLAFDQTVLARVFNPADPKAGEAAAANLIGTSMIIGATIITIGLMLVDRPQPRRRITKAVVGSAAMSLVFFMIYVYVQLSHYGY